jgi:hypothetical protein
MLFEEENRLRIDQDRKIRRLPSKDQAAAFAVEKARHDAWAAEYTETMKENKKQPLHDDGAWFKEKLLSRWY